MVNSDVEFEWDASKEIGNVKKHKMTFHEASETFFDSQGFQLTDKKRSRKEKRFFWVGKSDSGRILTTWFTHRQSMICIIGSAEWRKFRRFYYETTKIE